MAGRPPRRSATDSGQSQTVQDNQWYRCGQGKAEDGPRCNGNGLVASDRHIEAITRHGMNAMSIGFWFAAAAYAAALTPGTAIGSDNAADDVAAGTFSEFAELLHRHLTELDMEDDGLVSAFDYRQALARDDTFDLLARQRERLAAFDSGGLDTREKFNAFLLNAYNFFMISHLLEERPNGKLVDSVWDYGGRFNPFRANVFERDLFDIGGAKYSLDAIEKGILLGDDAWERGWAEARVHFAVNCAAVGCPPLRAEIYTPDNVDALLAENTRRAFNTPRHLHTNGRTLYLSSVFDWYEDDYVREAGSVRDFIRQYADHDVIEAMNDTNRIRYIDYDWTLNAPENFPEFESNGR
jgi:hypothetical protein